MLALAPSSNIAPLDAVAIGDTPDTLARILDPAIQLAIWRRPLPAALRLFAGQDRRRVDDIDQPIAVAALGAALPILLADAGFARDDAAATEIGRCARSFADIVGCAWLRLRLEVIETDGCKRFHADYVTARLLMTIAGTGTQWMRAGGDGAIEQLAIGEVALFKGRLWTGEPAILHRSPPIGGTGRDRLLLAIDPLE